MPSPSPGVGLTVVPVVGVGEVEAGTDLAGLLLDALTASGIGLHPGDCLVVSSKVVSKSLGLTWTQTMMAANAPMLTRAALVDGKVESGVLPSGQVVGVIDDLPTCKELIDRIVAEATKILENLEGSNA